MSNALYFRGQGKLKVAILDSNGAITGYTQVGNVSSLKLDPKVTWIEHREDMSGYRQLDLMIPNEQSLGVAFDLEVANAYNLQLALYGTTSANSASTTFSGVAVNAVTAGLDYVFGKAGATVTAVVDSSASPKTLVAGTDYLVNTDGTITVLNTTGFTMPLLVSGTQNAYSSVGILNKPSQEIAVLFEGLNTANSRKPVVINIGRVMLNPAKSIEVLGKDLVKFQLDGQALVSPNALSTGVLAGYGSIDLVA